MRVLNEDYMSLNETELNRAVQKDLFWTDVVVVMIVCYTCQQWFRTCRTLALLALILIRHKSK
jgi:hypothetical protein